nr:MAG TPA: hypothetical protein [Caudoviricetes sp.]
MTPLFKPKSSKIYINLIIFILNIPVYINSLLYKMHKFPFYQKLTTLIRIITIL